MLNTPLRLGIAIVFVVLMTLGTYRVREGLKPPTVIFPQRDFQQLPFQFGPWRGQTVELDPKIFTASEAKVSVNRLYRNDVEQPVSLLVALFEDPERGVYHSPINCYRSNGYEKLSETEKFQIPCGGDASINADLSTWEKDDGTKILVCYWYELSGHVFYDRTNLFGLRFAMRGAPTWPATIKVLMETAMTDNPEQDQARLKQLGASVYAWIHQDDGAATAAPKSK